MLGRPSTWAILLQLDNGNEQWFRLRDQAYAILVARCLNATVFKGTKGSTCTCLGAYQVKIIALELVMEVFEGCL